MAFELPLTDDRPVWDTFLSIYRLPALTVALDLNIMEALSGQPASSGELAGRLALDPRGMDALLPMLAIQDFLVKHMDRYQLTNTARLYLLKDSPYYWGGLLERMATGLPQHRQLREALEGKNNEQGGNGDIRRDSKKWKAGDIGLDQAREVASFMHSHSMPAASGLANRFSFDDSRNLLDVGGGSGCYAMAISHRHPHVHSTVLELPAMCEIASEYIAGEDLSQHVDVYACDMFKQDWPKGYDTLFFSNIFHDWGMDTCRFLAESAIKALPAGGRILIHEILMDENETEPDAAVAMSLLMAMGTEGRQFTCSQLYTLLEEAGFRNIAVQPAYGYFSLLSADKP